MATWDPDGAGSLDQVVVLAGNFDRSGAIPLNFVATFDGNAWSPLGSGFNGTTWAVATFDPDGAGPSSAEPVVGGSFFEAGGAPANRIARWDGTAWRPLGAGVGGTALPTVRHLLVDQSVLLVGGIFFTAGGLPVNHLAKWTGTTWQAFPKYYDAGCHGLAIYGGEPVMATLTILPGGSGFTGILRWTGAMWTTLGSNPPADSVDALTIHNGELIAGGFFSNVTGNPANPGDHIAAYDGQTWHPLGAGINDFVRTVLSFDPDGPGPSPNLLIAGGSFSAAGGQAAANIAAWDGTNWLAMGSGVNGSVRALCAYKGQLLVGGYFTAAGGQPAPYFARWGCPQPPMCYPDCGGDGALTVADFGCFQTRFVVGDPYADCNHDGALTVADFGCFQTKYVIGCP